jgi:hypothetical protein
MQAIRRVIWRIKIVLIKTAIFLCLNINLKTSHKSSKYKKMNNVKPKVLIYLHNNLNHHLFLLLNKVRIISILDIINSQCSVLKILHVSMLII